MLTTLVLCAAVMVLLLNLRELPFAGHCLQCGGMGKHKDDCPVGRDED